MLSIINDLVNRFNFISFVSMSKQVLFLIPTNLLSFLFFMELFEFLKDKSDINYKIGFAD